MSHGLGRLFAPDDRDAQYQIRPLLSATPSTRTYRYWIGGSFFDQGPKPHCVEYSWHHWLNTGPVRPKARAPYWTFGEPYAIMQTVDEWPGEGYDGTSVRAGAKVLTDMGYISEYRWAWDLETVVQTLLEKGPVVMGTNWYSDMFEPDAKGIVRASGYVAGGHAWLLDGVSRSRGMARAKNSWGRHWGRRGRFYIPFEDLEKLIHEHGEACLAVEVSR